MTTIKQFFIPVLLLLTAKTILAADEKFIFEPIYGMETTLVRYPEPPRYVTRAVYGARALYGVTLLSGEAEYTVAHSRKDYSAIDQTVEDRAERLALGLRTTLPVLPFAAVYFRAGGRADRGETKITTSGISETKDKPLRIDPYGGVGLQVAVHQNFALNAGATLIRNEEGKYDAQYTLGLSARFGTL